MEQKNQLKIGAFLSYGQMFLNIVIGLIYTPVMIRLLGQSEYGLYNTVSSTVAILSILTLGFNSSYIRYYSKYKREERQEDIFKLNGLFIIIFSVLGSIVLALGLFLSFNLNFVFADGLTAQEYDTAKILMVLLTINLASAFPLSVFTSIVSAHEKFVFLKIMGMIKTVLSPLITLPLLLLGFKSIALVSVTLGLSFVTDIIYFIYVKSILKNKFFFRGFERGIFKSLFAYTFFLTLNVIVDQINWNIGKFLLGRYQGTIAVAVYSVGFALYQYYMIFSSSISNVFTPRIHRIVRATEDNEYRRKEEITNLFIKVGRVQYVILGLLATGLIFFGKTFIGFWAGEGYEESYYVTILLVISATIPLIQNCGIEIQRALNRHKFRSIVYIAMAFVNLGITIYLSQIHGAVGAAIGTSVSMIVANGIIMNVYYHKKCYVNVIKFWKNILRVSTGMILPIIIGFVLKSIIQVESFWGLLGSIAIYTVVYCVSMYYLGMNDSERKLIKKPLKKLLKR